MNLHKTVLTSARVLHQLKHDPRTIALILLIPCIMVGILRFVFQGEQNLFNSAAPMLLGIFPLITMFLVTSIATLRERKLGTLDRLMVMPISKLDFVFGYALAFLLFAFLQACLASFVTLVLLNVPVAGGTLPLFISAILAGFLGTSVGLLVSAFASSEFQAVQFMPAFIMPQLLTCGLFVAREHMARPLQWFADLMPLTYSVDAMKQVTVLTSWSGRLSWDLLVVAVFGVAALMLGAVTIRRQQ